MTNFMKKEIYLLLLKIISDSYLVNLHHLSLIHIYFDYVSESTLKKWVQRYIWHVAKELGEI